MLSMSLKAFHIVFVAASILVSILYGVWAVFMYLTEGGLLLLASGMAAFLVAVALILYGGTVLKKFRDVSYL